MGLHIDGSVTMDDRSSLKWYESSGWGKRGFCADCGSHLFWAMKDESMMVPFAGSLDDQTDINFGMEIFVDEQPEFYEFKNQTVRKTGAEVVAEFSQQN